MATTTTDREPKTIERLFSQILGYQPNCLDFTKYFPDHFAVGSYWLEKDKQEEEANSTKENEAEESKNDKEPQVQKRTGKVVLYKLIATPHMKEGAKKGAHEISVVKLQEIELPSAVYDLHFNGNILMTTSTTGSLSLFETVRKDRDQGKFKLCGKAWWPHDPDDEPEHDAVEAHQDTPLDESVSLQHVVTTQMFSEKVLIIAMAWHPKFFNVLAVSLSDGRVVVLTIRCSPNSPLSKACISVISVRTQTHGDNAYCVAWGETFDALRDEKEWHVMHLVSGGDDSKLRSSQIWLGRDGGYSNSGYQMETQVSESGVTSLTHLPSKVTTSLTHLTSGATELVHSDMFLVGGYDNIARIVTIKSPRVIVEPVSGPPSLTATTVKLGAATPDLGGSIHKLSVMDYKISYAQLPVVEQKWRILATCAQVGVRIIVITSRNLETNIQVVAKFDEHPGLNYASGFLFKRLMRNTELKRFLEREDMALCVSTSFYDEKMCIWKYDPVNLES